MSASELPLAAFSQHGPPRRFKYCKPPPDFLYTIIEENEKERDCGSVPVSIYEDLSNYEIEDSFYNSGISPLHHPSLAVTNIDARLDHRRVQQ
jgi:hypothetical protein